MEEVWSSLESQSASSEFVLCL